MVIIPERFQEINGEGSLTAGLKLLPLLGACAVGSFIAGAVSSKRNHTSYTLIASSFLQTIGLGLMARIDEPSSSIQVLHVCLSIIGLGVGLCFGAATIATSLQVPTDDLATAHGAISQARLLGGCLGISIWTMVLATFGSRSPGTHRTTDGPDMSPGRFLETTERSHAAPSAAFATNMKIMVSVCSVMIFVSFFTWEKEPADISRLNTHHRSSCAGPKYNSLSTFKAG